MISEAQKQQLDDGVMGITMQVMTLESKLSPEDFETFVTRLLERKVVGSRLWDFFKEVAERDQDQFVKLVLDDDSRLEQYAVSGANS